MREGKKGRTTFPLPLALVRVTGGETNRRRAGLMPGTPELFGWIAQESHFPITCEKYEAVIEV